MEADTPTMMSPPSVSASNQIPNPSPTTRKRGRPLGSRNLCSKPKTLCGVKIRRTEQNVSSITLTEANNHSNSVASSSHTLTDQTGSLSHTTPVAQSTTNHSPDREAWSNTLSRPEDLYRVQHNDITPPGTRIGLMTETILLSLAMRVM